MNALSLHKQLAPLKTMPWQSGIENIGIASLSDMHKTGRPLARPTHAIG